MVDAPRVEDHALPATPEALIAIGVLMHRFSLSRAAATEHLQRLAASEGHSVAGQARRVLDEVGKIQGIARGGQDQLAGALRLGVIPTIGPYLLPELIPILKKRAPAMPLVIEENLTGNLAPMLREGELDVVIIALPFSLPGVRTLVVYEEPFSVVVPEGHRWQSRASNE